MSIQNINISDAKSVEALPGLIRTTLAYTQDQMICHFTVKAGVKMPMHTHEAAQIGYIVSGKMIFEREGDTSLPVSAGSGYCFYPNEPHRLVALEDTEFIEVFTPYREEYIAK